MALNNLQRLICHKTQQTKPNQTIPICQTTKIHMNTKVNKERQGSTFKIPSTTKSPIRTKQSNSQQPTKPLQRTYSIESMDSDTDRVVASLDLEEIIKNYNTWNHLTVGQLLSSVTFLNCYKPTTFDTETVLTLNWIVWNWTVFDIETVLTLNWIVIYNWIVWNRNDFDN